MPVGTLKNTIYGGLLPLAGKRCAWKASQDELERLLHRHHTVGACIQRFEKGRLTECRAVGCASLEGEARPVTPETVFRTASIAKMVSALLVFRLCTLGRLNTAQDVGELLGMAVRNPRHPQTPITLGMLMSHTSSIVDSPAYFASFAQKATLEQLLMNPQSYAESMPGTKFQYSNFAAGMIACVLEKRFGLCFEKLAQQELFAPLGVGATFDTARVPPQLAADSYRVLPAACAFRAQERIRAAKPLEEADVQHHYLLASGNLYLTAADLARLALAAWNGADGFLNDECLKQLHTPLLGWPQPQVCMRHGMGLLQLEEASVCSRTLWGHQGFAYGAVNGVFFDAQGNGFASLNSGTSERRLGHLALVNRDLIRLWLEA